MADVTHLDTKQASYAPGANKLQQTNVIQQHEEVDKEVKALAEKEVQERLRRETEILMNQIRASLMRSDRKEGGPAKGQSQVQMSGDQMAELIQDYAITELERRGVKPEVAQRIIENMKFYARGYSDRNEETQNLKAQDPVNGRPAAKRAVTPAQSTRKLRSDPAQNEEFQSQLSNAASTFAANVSSSIFESTFGPVASPQLLNQPNTPVSEAARIANQKDHGAPTFEAASGVAARADHSRYFDRDSNTPPGSIRLNFQDSLAYMARKAIGRQAA